MKQDEQIYTAKQMDYAAYVKKFIPNYVYTTDDTFTPPKVYQSVIDWLTMEGKIQGRRILRPFYPGGDFEAIDYQPGDFVVDNPAIFTDEPDSPFLSRAQNRFLLVLR